MKIVLCTPVCVAATREADSFAFSSPSPSQSLRIGGAETTAAARPGMIRFEVCLCETIEFFGFLTASEVELTVYSGQGLPDALIQKGRAFRSCSRPCIALRTFCIAGGGGPSTISKCRVSTNIGLQIKATEWTALNQDQTSVRVRMLISMLLLESQHHTIIILVLSAPAWRPQEPGRPGECHDSSLWGAAPSLQQSGPGLLRA